MSRVTNVVSAVTLIVLIVVHVTTEKGMKICGADLPKALSAACGTGRYRRTSEERPYITNQLPDYLPFWRRFFEKAFPQRDNRPASHRRITRSGLFLNFLEVAKECCSRGCSLNYLRQFC